MLTLLKPGDVIVAARTAQQPTGTPGRHMIGRRTPGFSNP